MNIKTLNCININTTFHTLKTPKTKPKKQLPLTRTDEGRLMARLWSVREGRREGELPPGRLGEGGPVVEGEGQAGHGGEVSRGRGDLGGL